MRKFEVVKEEHKKYGVKEVTLPIRSTINSAGYDMFSPIDITIEPNTIETIFTNVKAICNSDEFIMVCVRSSMGKKGVCLANDVGIIDSDYYSNPNNDGNIGVMLKNTSSIPFEIKAGDKIAQAIFMKYLVVDNDVPANNIRTSGFGSTGK